MTHTKLINNLKHRKTNRSPFEAVYVSVRQFVFVSSPPTTSERQNKVKDR